MTFLDHGIMKAVIHRLSVFIKLHGRAKYLGVVDAANELPLSRHVPSAVASFSAAYGSGRARHNG